MITFMIIYSLKIIKIRCLTKFIRLISKGLNSICYFYGVNVNRHKSLWNSNYNIYHLSILIHQLTADETTWIILVYLLNNCVGSVQHQIYLVDIYLIISLVLFVSVNFSGQSILHSPLVIELIV